MINKTNVFNPIYGLSSHQIVRLLEQGTTKCLSENHRELALIAVQQHIEHVPEANMRTVLNSLFQVTALRAFASVAFKSFLGEQKEALVPAEKIA